LHVEYQNLDVNIHFINQTEPVSTYLELYMHNPAEEETTARDRLTFFWALSQIQLKQLTTIFFHQITSLYPRTNNAPTPTSTAATNFCCTSHKKPGGLQRTWFSRNYERPTTVAAFLPDQPSACTLPCLLHIVSRRHTKPVTGPQQSAISHKPRIIRPARAGAGYRYLHDASMLRCQITMCNKPFALVLQIWRDYDLVIFGLMGSWGCGSLFMVRVHPNMPLQNIFSWTRPEASRE